MEDRSTEAESISMYVLLSDKHFDTAMPAVSAGRKGGESAEGHSRVVASGEPVARLPPRAHPFECASSVLLDRRQSMFKGQS